MHRKQHHQGPLQSESGGRQAVWGDLIVARTEETIIVDGFEYFPPDSIDWDRLIPSSETSVCPWKGTANYFDIVDGDDILKDAAWTYSSPKDAASNIKDYVGFWRGVEVKSGRD